MFGSVSSYGGPYLKKKLFLTSLYGRGYNVVYRSAFRMQTPNGRTAASLSIDDYKKVACFDLQILKMVLWLSW